MEGFGASKLPGFGTWPSESSEPEKSQSSLQPRLVTRQLKAIAAADRILSQRVYEEAGKLEARVARAKQDLNVAKQQVDEAQEVQLHLLELQQQLDRQIREHRESLAIAAEERRRLIELACGAPHRDATAAKRRNLEEALHDEMRYVEEMHESNALLEESVRTLMLEMDMLHEERLSTLQEALGETPNTEEASFPVSFVNQRDGSHRFREGV